MLPRFVSADIMNLLVFNFNNCFCKELKDDIKIKEVKRPGKRLTSGVNMIIITAHGPGFCALPFVVFFQACENIPGPENYALIPPSPH